MTFSIIGFDPLKNRFGVAVSSCHIAVGSTVSFVRSQVGAVATQGQTNPYLGIVLSHSNPALIRKLFWKI